MHRLNARFWIVCSRGNNVIFSLSNNEEGNLGPLNCKYHVCFLINIKIEIIILDITNSTFLN